METYLDWDQTRILPFLNKRSSFRGRLSVKDLLGFFLESLCPCGVLSKVFPAALFLAALVWGPLGAQEIPKSGTNDPRWKPLDQMLIDFSREHEVPGLAIAVGRKGKIVYSAGMGYTEPAGTPKRKPVQPQTRFRIASLSKPITAAAILILAQRGKLALEDKVLDRVSLKPLGGKMIDPRWKEITLRHLLNHTAGFDRTKSFDPMFRSIAFAKEAEVPAPASAETVIRVMLGRPLDFDPGTRYAYSNFGYCLLGRVIETASGQTYEEFVKRELLQPAGITSMAIGKSLAQGRFPQETHYFDPTGKRAPSVFPPHAPVERPFGTWFQESLDAHGGWVASAEDLVRLSLYLDPDQPGGPLNEQAWKTIGARPGIPRDGTSKEEESKPWYGLGWQVREVIPKGQNHWHTGLLPGTSALWVRRHDRFHWVILFNSRGKESAPPLASLIDPLLHKAINAVKDLPPN